MIDSLRQALFVFIGLESIFNAANNFGLWMFQIVEQQASVGLIQESPHFADLFR